MHSKLTKEKLNSLYLATHTTGMKSIQIQHNIVRRTSNIKILGFTLDCTMTLEKQVSNTYRSAHIYTRKINSIRRYLTENAAKTLIQSLVHRIANENHL